MRPRRKLSVLTAAAAALALTAPAAHADVSACPSAEVTPAAQNVDQVERTILCLVNQERTSRGLRALRTDARLAKAAVKHSQDMVRRDYFDHVSPGGATPLARIRATGWFHGARSYLYGENLAWGTGDLSTPQSIVGQWMDSPPHRQNILTGRFTVIGVGVAPGAPGHDGGATYTTDFGAKG